jgi:hypothetical protein
MSDVSRGYLIDSDVLITAKNGYYAFPICPGFWDSLLHAHSLNVVYSIDRVKQELLQGREDDDLVQWVNNAVPSDFFIASGGSTVIQAFAQIMLWVTRNPQYLDAAKAKFASGADGWLVAHGLATGKIVVTNEQPRPNAQNQIKLPDVCNAFGVLFEDTFAMLHKLRVQYHFSPNP